MVCVENNTPHHIFIELYRTSHNIYYRTRIWLCVLLVLVVHGIAGIRLGAAIELFAGFSPISSTASPFLRDGLDVVRTMVEATVGLLWELLLAFRSAAGAPAVRGALFLLHCACLSVHTAGVQDLQVCVLRDWRYHTQGISSTDVNIGMKTDAKWKQKL